MASQLVVSIQPSAAAHGEAVPGLLPTSLTDRPIPRVLP